MRPRTSIRPVTTVRTRTQTLLQYGAIGLAIAGVVATILFIYFQFGPSQRGFATGLPGYEYRQEITIQQGLVAGGEVLYNFPVLIEMHDSNLRNVVHGGLVVHENGADIRFTDASGVGTLKHSIVSYSPREGHLKAWVQVPVLAPSVTTTLFVYFGNAAETLIMADEAVWDNSFTGIWSLEGMLKDGSLNKLNTHNNGTVPVAGRIGTGAGFDGTGSYIRVSDNPALSLTTEGTIEAWVRPQSFSNYAGIVHKGDLVNTTDEAYFLQLGGPALGNSQSSQVVFGIRHASGERFVVSKQHLQAEEWYHVAATWDSDSIRLYINGVPEASVVNPYAARTTSGGLNIGTLFHGQPSRYPFHGVIDELRISHIARTSAWVETTHRVSNNPQGYFSFSITSNLTGGGTQSSSCAFTADTLAGFGYRFRILLDEAMVAGSATMLNVPVLIDITDNDLRPQSQGGLLLSSEGHDMRFSAGDGTTLLNFQVEQYLPGQGRLIAWVLVPELKHDEDTELFLYVQNGDLVGSPGSTSSTWPSEYVAVWHLDEEPSGNNSPMTDYSGNGRTANTLGGMNSNSSVSGKIGKGLTFTGSNQYLRVEAHSSLNLVNNGNYTLSAWVRTSSAPDVFRGALHQENGSGSGRLLLGIEKGNNSTCSASNTYYSMLGNSSTCSGVTYNSDWQHLALTVRENGTTDTVRLYVNGVLAVTTIRNSETNNNARWRLGGALQNNRYWNGDMDEIRFMNMLMGPDRILTEYRNMNNPGQYTDMSCPQQINVPSFILPISLAYFDAEAQQNASVLLEWGTTQETDNDYYTIERSADGHIFETIGEVQGAGTTHQPTTYAWTDDSPHTGISYYRLKQTDFGGQITELPIRKVELNVAAMSLQIIRAYPNPFRESVMVEFTSDFAASGTMVITNTNGSRVHMQPVNVREGTSNLTLNIGHLPAGTYILQLMAGEVRTEGHRLIKSQ